MESNNAAQQPRKNWPLAPTRAPVFIGVGEVQERQLWDQKKTESAEDFDRFRRYLHLGVERSLRKVWLHENPTTNLNDKPPFYWQQMFKKHEWVLRAEAWERDQQLRFDEILLQKRVQARHETLMLGAKLREKASEALALLKLVEEEVETRVENGVEVKVIMQKVVLTPNEIVKMATAGMEMEQLMMGEATQRVAVGGEVSHEHKHQHIHAHIATEDARQIVADRLQEIRSRNEIISSVIDGPTLSRQLVDTAVKALAATSDEEKHQPDLRKG